MKGDFVIGKKVLDNFILGRNDQIITITHTRKDHYAEGTTWMQWTTWMQLVNNTPWGTGSLKV